MGIAKKVSFWARFASFVASSFFKGEADKRKILDFGEKLGTGADLVGQAKDEGLL